MADAQKVLFFDLETAGVQGLAADRAYVVCFGWKWGGEKTAHVKTLLDYPGRGGMAKWPANCQDDGNLLRFARKLMEDADLVVAHYGAKFDIPFFRARLARVGLDPIPPTRNCDTCLLARSYYKLSSNRLANLADFLNCTERKMEKGRGWPDWWMGALRGDKPSIRAMATYCAQDVATLEAVFLKMRPVIPGRYLLNQGMGLGHYCCEACGAPVQFRGVRYSEKKVWRRFVCKQCGRWGREEKAIARTYAGHQPVR